MMKIAFVGAGRVGISLSAFFLSRGFDVVGIATRSSSSVERAQRYLPAIRVVKDVLELGHPDVIFITVVDSAIASVAEKVREAYPDSVVVHTSGAHSSNVIPGEGKASCHPLQSLASVEVALEMIPKSLFTVEGDEKGLDVLERILKMAGLRYVGIEPEAKPLYHAAAVVASNYLVTLMYKAVEIMKLSGFPEKEGTEGLVALAEGTLRNISEKGVPDALTGPIAREDVDTVKLHLSELKRHNLDEFYRYMANLTAEMVGKGFRF